MARKNGGIIGPANVPTGNFGSAPGVWSLAEVKKYINEGIWPVATSGFQVANSLRFDDGSSDYLSRSVATTGNRRTWTFSAWVKRANTTQQYQNMFAAGLNNIRINFSNQNIWVYDYNGSGFDFYLITNRLFRDTNAFYHIVVAVDTTQATSSDRVKLYINGVQETSFSTETYPSQNHDTEANTSGQNNVIGTDANSLGSNSFDGYMSEVVLIDGQQLDETSFGETDATTGNWVPKDVSGLTFGTNGFYLPFQNAAALGQDDSGNGNNFTVNNLTSIDQCIDSPTNNFATMNPLFYQSATAVTYSNGNCTTSSPTTGGTAPVSNIEVPKTGKWYCEIKVDSTTGSISNNSRIGIAVPLPSNPSNPTYNARYLSDGTYTLDASNVAYGATFAAGDIIGIAVDSDSNTIEFYKNGVSQGSLSYTMQSDETYFFTACEASNTIGINYSYNFGNPPFTISSGNTDYSGLGNFEYEVPSGYRALCTKNIGLVG